jgi:hypothetical protein
MAKRLPGRLSNKIRASGIGDWLCRATKPEGAGSNSVPGRTERHGWLPALAKLGVPTVGLSEGDVRFLEVSASCRCSGRTIRKSNGHSGNRGPRAGWEVGPGAGSFASWTVIRAVVIGTNPKQTRGPRMAQVLRRQRDRDRSLAVDQAVPRKPRIIRGGKCDEN